MRQLYCAFDAGRPFVVAAIPLCVRESAWCGANVLPSSKIALFANCLLNSTSPPAPAGYRVDNLHFYSASKTIGVKIEVNTAISVESVIKNASVRYECPESTDYLFTICTMIVYLFGKICNTTTLLLPPRQRRVGACYFCFYW